MKYATATIAVVLSMRAVFLLSYHHDCSFYSISAVAMLGAQLDSILFIYFFPVYTSLLFTFSVLGGELFINFELID